MKMTTNYTKYINNKNYTICHSINKNGIWFGSRFKYFEGVKIRSFTVSAKTMSLHNCTPKAYKAIAI